MDTMDKLALLKLSKKLTNFSPFRAQPKLNEFGQAKPGVRDRHDPDRFTDKYKDEYDALDDDRVNTRKSAAAPTMQLGKSKFTPYKVPTPKTKTRTNKSGGGSKKPPDNPFSNMKDGDEENKQYMSKKTPKKGPEDYERERGKKVTDTDDYKNTVKSYMDKKDSK